MQWISNAKRNQALKEGSVFELKGIESRIVIHKIHGCGNELYLSFHDLDISSADLLTEDFEEAVEEAKKVITKKLSRISNDVYIFVSDDTDNNFVRY